MCVNDLKQSGPGMSNYERNYGVFPPATDLIAPPNELWQHPFASTGISHRTSIDSHIVTSWRSRREIAQVDIEERVDFHPVAGDVGLPDIEPSRVVQRREQWAEYMQSSAAACYMHHIGLDARGHRAREPGALGSVTSHC